MNCKNCIHFSLCDYNTNHSVIMPKVNLFFDKGAERCSFFKDKSKVIELTCKVGDTVYYFKTLQDGKNTVIIEEDVVRQISINSHGKFIVLSFCHCLSCNDFGKTVFLTKESAKQALRERETK